MTLHILPLLDPRPALQVAVRRDFSLDGMVLNDHLRFVRKIGAGTYGLIYLVEDTANGAQYAAKIVLTEPHPARGNVADNKKHIREAIYNYCAAHQPLVAQELDLAALKRDGATSPFFREIALHLRVHDHPSIVTIHKVAVLERFAVLTFMDYYAQGDLFGSIIDDQLFVRPPLHTDKQLLMKNCMLQLTHAVEFCASRGVYHCDLKPENVMVSYDPTYVRPRDATHIIDYRELRVSLIDFGLAMTSNLICCNACRGLSFYMAPERIVNYNTNRLVRSLVDMDQYETDAKSALELTLKYFPTLAGDIWLLGVLFINIACARNPWPVANINDRHEVFSNYILNNKSILRTILPILRQFNELLNEIFELDPNRRVPLASLAHKIARCDFFDDKVEYNDQLCTPPTELKSNPPTPVPSHSQMSQCKQQVKVFGCPNHT